MRTKPNPVFVSQHFQYIFEKFSNKLLLMVHYQKKFHIIRTKFQETASLHVLLFICIFNAPNIQNEVASVKFFEKMINAQLPDHLIETLLR